MDETKYVTCPYCGSKHKLTKDDYEELNEDGKAVIDCRGCFHYFAVRDEGEGLFVCKLYVNQYGRIFI